MLEDSAKGPVVNPVEMGMSNLDAAINRIRAIPGYRNYFNTAFSEGDSVTMGNAAKAIAVYERTIRGGRAGDATLRKHRLYKLPFRARLQRPATAGWHRVLHEIPDVCGFDARGPVRSQE